MIHLIQQSSKHHGERGITVNKKHFSLSTKLFLITCFSGMLGFATYAMMRANSLSYYQFLHHISIIKFDPEAKAKEIQEKAKTISIDDIAGIKKLMDQHDQYTSMWLYEYRSGDYIEGSFASILEEPYDFAEYLTLKLYYVQSDFETAIYNNQMTKKIDFKDGQAVLVVNDLHGLKYSTHYFYISLMISILVCILPALLFMHRKVKYIKYLQNSVETIESGDLQTNVKEQSHDELTALASGLNHLRETLDTNIQKEKEARDANHKLITTMSHDLRTPLTVLQGYLEILRLNKFKDEETKRQYLENCLENVKHIRVLADKTFEYATVFDATDCIKLETVSLLSFIEYIKYQIEYLQMEEFLVEYNVSNDDAEISINLEMMKRVVNNLISNIYKYADKKQPVHIQCVYEDHHLKLLMQNTVRTTDVQTESNHIGLESVKRVIKLHQGTCYYKLDKDVFSISIDIPC